MQQGVSFRRLLVVLLAALGIPALCLGGAYATGLQITSPYFNVSFGPDTAPPPVSSLPRPTVISISNPITPDNPSEPPSNPPGDGGGGDNGGGDGDGTPRSATCLLNLLCLELNASVGSLPALGLSLGKGGPTSGANGLNLGLDVGVLDLLSSTPAPAVGGTPAAGCVGTACISATLPVNGNDLGLSVQVPPLNTGVQAGLGGENDVDLNLSLPVVLPTTAETSINVLNLLEVGVGSGTGGVGINLNLFP